MARPVAALQRIENKEQITPEFLRHLQRALLLALREQGRLNAVQYRHAEQALRKDAS